jgi:hypothetical protein
VSARRLSNHYLRPPTCLTDFVYNLIISGSLEKDPFLNRSINRTLSLLLTAGKIGAPFEKVGDTLFELFVFEG